MNKVVLKTTVSAERHKLPHSRDFFSVFIKQLFKFYDLHKKLINLPWNVRLAYIQYYFSSLIF